VKYLSVSQKLQRRGILHLWLPNDDITNQILTTIPDKWTAQKHIWILKNKDERVHEEKTSIRNGLKKIDFIAHSWWTTAQTTHI
jgi:hypothetical protein